MFKFLCIFMLSLFMFAASEAGSNWVRFQNYCEKHMNMMLKDSAFHDMGAEKKEELIGCVCSRYVQEMRTHVKTPEDLTKIPADILDQIFLEISICCLQDVLSIEA